MKRHHILKDWLGTPRMTLDASGAVAQAGDYFPYGRQMDQRSHTAVPEAGRHRFTGHEHDTESGYDYHGARYYQAEVGRYLGVDVEAGKYTGWSSYCYVLSNPISMADPSGKSGEVTIEGNTIVVTSKIYFYGCAASPELAQSVSQSIQDSWNHANARVDWGGAQYNVEFRVSGEYVTRESAKELAKANTELRNNFVLITDGEDWSSKAGDKASGFNTPKNSGYFLLSDLQPGNSTPSHEMGHGWGWADFSELKPYSVDLRSLNQDVTHDVDIVRGVPGIMSPRGTPVNDAYGYDNQSPGSKTVDPFKRRVLPSDVYNLKNGISISTDGKVGLGELDNVIFNDDGTID